jgi:hypothetical protein
LESEEEKRTAALERVLDTVKAENMALRERAGRLESEERKRMEELEERHGRVLEAVKAENAALRERVAGLESEERKLAEVAKAENVALLESEEAKPIEALEEGHGRLREALKAEGAALWDMFGGFQPKERKPTEMIEERYRRVIGALKAENASLIRRIVGLESEERKRMEELKERHEKLMDAVKVENQDLLARVDEFEPEEKIALPPIGQGILRFLKQRNGLVQITVSSHYAGSTGHLLVEDNSAWYSQNLPNSWIQWTITGGLKAIISSVKIMGLPSNFSGVRDFIIQGSNDNAVWTTIIDSKTCPTTFENFVTQAEALPQPQCPFSIIRLTQTGPRYRPPYNNDHHLILTYVDFGGRIVFPATAK